MKSNESAEMYLESILSLREQQQDVRAIDVARYTGYSKPSVSRAMGLLKDAGYITVAESGHLSLTESGATLASKILERHRLLSSFLVALGVSPQTADEDACKIEHVISDESFEKIKAHAKKHP